MLICIISIFLLFLYAPLKAQGEDISFHHLNVADGLSQNTVNTAYHDSRGFMWFGTQDGLNRYDGYEFIVYRNDPDDPASLHSNWIWSIGEDSRGNIWVGTFGGGLSCFNRNDEKFTTFTNDPHDSLSISHDTVWDFLEYPAGTFWVATNNGLNRMKILQTDTLKAQFEYIPHDTVNNNIFKIIHAEDGYLWLSSFRGLHRFNINSYEYTSYPLKKGIQNFGRMRGHYGQSGNLWLNSPKHGLFKFNLQTEEITHYDHDPAKPAGSIYSDFVISVCEDDEGIVWVGTTAKLSLIHPGGQIRHLESDPLNPGSLSHDFISNIYKGRDSSVWVSTRGGLDIYNKLARKFRHVRFIPDSRKSFSSPNITGFLTDSAGDFWISTNNGLNRYNPQKGFFEYYFKNDQFPEQGPNADYILDLLEDEKGNIWVATRNGGVSVWQRETDTFRHFNNPLFPVLENGVVLSLLQDSDNKIWIGTNSNGLYRYDPVTNEVIAIPHNAADPQEKMNDISVFSLFEDSKGRLFAGTAAGGINIIDRESFKVKHLKQKPGDKKSISNNRVLCFAETKRGDIWVGTAQGLNKMITGDDGAIHFKQYRTKDGLPNEVIYGIVEDGDGYLWISTNNGIARINVNKSFEVRSFYVEDGLQGNEFNQNAWYKDSEGLIYFGGSNGYNVFNPDQLRLNQQQPPVYITRLRVLDKEIRPSPESILEKTISETEHLTMPWQYNVFSFEFAALNYIKPEKNQYAYKMDGFDEDWIYSGARRFATYTNLDAGTYIFRVKASNNDGVWNEKGTSIQIDVLPPPWKSWWAYLLYGLSAIVIIGGYVRLQIRAKDKELETFARIERAKSEERALVRKKASADFHDEAGNLITKITLLTTLAKRSLQNRDSLALYLQKIEDNAKQISGSMRDFIWVLDPDKDTLFDTLTRLEDFCNSMFEFSGTQFITYGMNDKFKAISLSLDERRAIILIFKEAANNCVKYARAEKAWISISIEHNCVQLSFCDNGRGFESGLKKDGYGLKNMRNRAARINASLKITSIPGEGTQVIFRKNLEASAGNTTNG